MVVAPAGLLYLILVCFAAVTSEAAKCNPSKCRPEDNCFCMSRQPPGNLSVEEMPQLVMLTFDDHVNAENMDFYRQLLAPGKRKNRANGCNMVTTFFVSTVYTDFSFVHELHSTGNEIALHSITHRYNYTYWKTLDAAGWEAELLGGRDILRDYALIPEEDMVGARAPFLEPGTGDSHVVMQEHGLLYDSSVTVNYMEELDKLRVYPYTLDHGLQTLCVITPCLEGTYKGLWTVPLNGYYRTVQDDPGSLVQSPCAMADSCDPQPLTQTETFGHLRSNFELYYHYNKAPSPIFIHEVWLHEPERARGFLAFIDWLLTKDDVFFVTVEEVVRFMKNPKPLKQYVQSKCSKATEFTRCPEIHSCEFAEAQIYGTRWLRSCRRCPGRYPWILEVAPKESQRVTWRSSKARRYLRNPESCSPQLQKESDHQDTFHELDSLIRQIKDSCSPRPQEEAYRQQLLFELESLILPLYEDAKLTLYGSSCNGFGFRRSDLDVCLTFDRSQDGKDINHKKMIKALAYKLRRYQELENVIPITGAKVPIVQFLHAPSGLEVNICLYNKLVHHNTRLLKTYSLIDIRVQELGYALKHLAKTKGIANASRGGLSSYAFVLMAIYYLQQCRPPVVPVLQELYPEGAPKPEVMIDGWNTWFFDDIDHLEQVWSDFGQNKQSVGQLWLGMLRFYTREFSFKRLVVCIRQKAPLTRLEKEWNSRCVAIEDPFKLDHNLGRTLIRKVKVAMTKALSDELATNSKNLLGTPTHELLGSFPADTSASPNSVELNDKKPPGDGSCDQRDQSGHHVEECPQPWSSSPEECEDRNPDTSETTAGIAYSYVAKKALAQNQPQQREPGAAQTRTRTRQPIHRQPGGRLADRLQHIPLLQSQPQQLEQPHKRKRRQRSRRSRRQKGSQQKPEQPQTHQGHHPVSAAEVPPLPQPPTDSAPQGVVEARVQEVALNVNEAGLHHQVAGAKPGPCSDLSMATPSRICVALMQPPLYPGANDQPMVMPSSRHKMPSPPSLPLNKPDNTSQFGGSQEQELAQERPFFYGPPPKPAFTTTSSARK